MLVTLRYESLLSLTPMINLVGLSLGHTHEKVTFQLQRPRLQSFPQQQAFHIQIGTQPCDSKQLTS